MDFVEKSCVGCSIFFPQANSIVSNQQNDLARHPASAPPYFATDMDERDTYILSIFQPLPLNRRGRL